MDKVPYNDKELQAMIRKGDEERDEALHVIYSTWGIHALAILRSRGVSETDAEDARQDAIIVFDNHIRNGGYRGEGSMKNYFIGIFKWCLYSNLIKTQRIDWQEEDWIIDGTEEDHPEVLMLDKENKNLIRKLFEMEALGEKCKRLLKLYRLGLSMKEIAKSAQLGNANNARQRIHACRRKLANLVVNYPSLQNYFKNQA